MPDKDTPAAAATHDAGSDGAESHFQSSPFYAALDGALKRRGMQPAHVCDLRDAVARRLLAEYGAMFLATERVLVPPCCVFQSEEGVAQFQQQAGVYEAAFGAQLIELQPVAMEALLAACDVAARSGLTITPRGGAEAARRSYADTLRLWDSRFQPALEHWTTLGKLAGEEAARLRSLAPARQLVEVLTLEEQELFFSKDFSKSILYSVAAPGASQHLSLLAFDVAEFQEPEVRAVLGRHGWHQTVRSDLPHFTFLGIREKDLPDIGLKPIAAHGQQFWIPNVN